MLKNYKILSVISSGNFSNVYKCCDIKTHKCYAIKSDNTKLLKHEADIYNKLREIENIPKIYDFFCLDTKYFLVLDLMSCNLIDYKNRNYESDKYTDKLIIIITQLLTTIEKIHNKSIVHRDLKPNNICFDKNHKLFIIDFGLSKDFIVNNRHIENKKINNIIGSSNFCSLNVLNLLQPSRRDDIESIIYILIYLLLNDKNYTLFNNLSLANKKDISTIEKILNLNNNNYKNSFGENFCKNIILILNYTRRLHFDQQPNYSYILKQLIN